MKTTAKPSKKKTNPHGWFFTYTRSLEGYDKDYEKVIREGIVCQHSGGKTESLKTLYEAYPTLYNRMKKQLQFEQPGEVDKARKRVMAVLFSYAQFNGYKADKEYVKRIACNAAQVDSFNAIGHVKLRQLYRIFGDMHNKEADRWVSQVLTKATEPCTNGQSEK